MHPNLPGVMKCILAQSSSYYCSFYPRDEPASGPQLPGLRVASYPQNRMCRQPCVASPHSPLCHQAGSNLGSRTMTTPPAIEKCACGRCGQFTTRTPDVTLSPMSICCLQWQCCAVSHEGRTQHIPLLARLCSWHWACTEAHRRVVAGLMVQLERQDILIMLCADRARLCT